MTRMPGRRWWTRSARDSYTRAPGHDGGWRRRSPRRAGGMRRSGNGGWRSRRPTGSAPCHFAPRLTTSPGAPGCGQAGPQGLAGLAGPVRRAGRAGPALAGVTAREREVLRLLAAGRSNREIAAELFIATKTASVHVSNILGKLGAASRTEAAAIAHREGVGLPARLR